jgi:DNA repair exonuclease SbcCD ATPase subunit
MSAAAPDTQPSPSTPASITPASGPVSTPARKDPADELVERFDRAVDSRGIVMPDEQRDSLHVRLHEIVDELVQRGVPMFSARSGPLHVQRVRLAGLIPFQQPVTEPYEFDFDRTSGPIVALVGRNGHGKSTLIEAGMGAIFGNTFSRGPLNDVAVGQDIPWQVGVDIETATGAWRVERRRGAVAVCRAGERQPVARGRDAVASWVRANVPAPAVLMAGAFGVQRHHGHLLQLEPAPARDVVLSLLGLEVYQAVSRAAGERVRITEAESATQAGRIDELQRAVNVEHDAANQITLLVGQLDESREQLAHAQEALTAARDAAPNPADETLRLRQLAMIDRELRDARARLATHEKELDRAANTPPPADTHALDAVVDATRVRLTEARAQLREVEQRVTNAKDVRIAKLRVAITELGMKRKDAPTMSVRVILEDNVFAQNIQRDVAQLDDLYDAVVLSEQAHDAASRAAFDARVQDDGIIVDVDHVAGLIDQARADIVRLESEAAPLRIVPVEQPCDVRELEIVVQAKHNNVRRMERDFALAQSRVERANEARARFDENVARAEALTLERNEWWLISDLFGRTGIQGDAIDEIGPTIDAHANRLLDECADGRWVVKTESTAKGEENGRETFEIWVYDRQQDIRWKNGRHLSPGESGIVGEAIAGAVALIASAAHPHVRPTLVRDEIAVDIDRLDVQTWMRILRREAELLNASGVFVVSHDRNVVASCDTRLLVQHGQVTELREKEVTSG